MEGAAGVQDPRWQELGCMDWNRRELEGGGQPGSLSAGLGLDWGHALQGREPFLPPLDQGPGYTPVKGE